MHCSKTYSTSGKSIVKTTLLKFRKTYHLGMSVLLVYQYQHLDPSISLLYIFATISVISPFRRLRQAEHIAEGKATPQQKELRALLYANSVWVL